MRHLVCVMNARAIPECIDSLQALDCDVAWMSGYTDAELGPVHQRIVRTTDYDTYIVISDDCIATQAALDAVTDLLEAGHPAATGWCKLHTTSDDANICHSPIIGDHPNLDAYPFYKVRDVRDHPDPVVPTHFMGFSFTGMTRDLWQRFPYAAYTEIRRTGYSSDFHLCHRLRDAGVPMVAARDGYVEHLKTLKRPKPRSHRLLIGRMAKEVRIASAVT